MDKFPSSQLAGVGVEDSSRCLQKETLHPVVLEGFLCVVKVVTLLELLCWAVNYTNNCW